MAKSNLILTLDKNNSIVLQLANGETIELQLGDKQKKQATIQIRAEKHVRIFRATRKQTIKEKERQNG